jgi:hypothetical protein
MTLGSHQRTIGKSQVRITPRAILDPLGEFDLDPAGNDPRPWDCAKVTYTERENGARSCGRHCYAGAGRRVAPDQWVAA